MTAIPIPFQPLTNMNEEFAGLHVHPKRQFP